MRKTCIFAIIIALLSFSSCSKYKYEQVDGDPTKTRIYTLDNGLKVYLSVNDEEPRIQTFIAVKVGGKNDPAQTTGLAHYFEHLMFKGTQQFGTSDYEAEKPMLDDIERLFETYRVTTDEAERAAIYHTIDSISYEASKLAIPNEYDKLMSIIGASGTNAFTSTDMTVYTEDIPSNQIENWAMIEADRFKNPVIRLFHTELETIYEEKNMSLTQDARKVYEAMNAALYPNHPYGTQTVLGTQEHLKNPSITNVKNYHKTYYVPNNMAICMSGDFNPDEVIQIIDKYFGDMQPNPDLPELEFTPEKPITEPIVKEVYGLESESISIGWRLPASKDRSNDIAQMAGFILSNGTAGLIDLDLLQNQKILSGYGYASLLPDYGSFELYGKPKEGQTLDEVKDLIRDAKPGDTIKVNARSYDRMPYSVMRVLGEQDDLLLHITWNDGEDIWITSDFAANEPQRVYYPLEELVDMDLSEQPEEQGTGTPGKVNPPTGGILEISAPVPYSEAVHNTGKTADASLARPSENARAAEETDTAKPESGNSLALTAAAIVVLAAGGAGFWFWKKKYQD